MIGTIVNSLAVAIGTILGLLFGNFLSEKVRQTITRGVGLLVIILGTGMALALTNDLGLAVVSIVSIALGALIGEILNIEGILEKIGEWLKKHVSRVVSSNEVVEEGSQGWSVRFVDGFVSSSLLFCVGPMTILGSINDGLGDPSLLIIKSFLDGLFSIMLSATLGIGVFFSIIVILIYQGGITLFSGILGLVLGPAIITGIGTVGGLLILGLGINLTEIGKLRVGNMLPSLVVVAILIWLIQVIQSFISWLSIVLV